MKLLDTMKDEDLGRALLYNFTKAYSKPVPMSLYDIVLPLLYHDFFLEEVLKHDNLKNCIQSCMIHCPHFKEELLENLDKYKNTTSKALGMALIQGQLVYELVDNTMCGKAIEAPILPLNEAIHLASLLEGYTYETVLILLQYRNPNIVFLETETLGEDIDLTVFEQLGNVKYYVRTSYDEIIDRLQDVDIVVVNKCKMDSYILSQCPSLKCIALSATGFDNVDLLYCKEHFIEVCNVVGYSTDSVVQHTLALVLELIERTSYYDQYIKSKQYTKSTCFSHFKPFRELSSMTWGIVGLGNIGKKMALAAKTLGVKVQYYSTSGKNSTSLYQEVDFDTLLKTSDIISIHAPKNENTYHLFNEFALRKMKKDAILVNVGRGGIIDEEALVHVLNDNHLAGVGLDVFEMEPLSEDSVLYNVNNMNKLLLTPHIAWASIESRQRCVDEVYKNILAFLKNEKRNSLV